MKAFIVSLKLETRRRLASIRLARFLGIEFELVDALDGRTSRRLPRSPAAWKHLTNAEVACHLSHLRALRRIVDLNIPCGIILEDDFDFIPGARLGLADILNETPADFSHISLHSCKLRINPPYRVESRAGYFQKLQTCALLACGYIISREFAVYLLNEHALPARPIDWLYVELSREFPWKFYDLVQPIIRTRGAPTTIQIPHFANISSHMSGTPTA